MVAQQATFRRAAAATAPDLAKLPQVRAVALFGSLVPPLVREVPRFAGFRHHGIEVFHECKDIDLAIRSIASIISARSIARAVVPSPTCSKTAESALPTTRSTFSCSGISGATISAGSAPT